MQIIYRKDLINTQTKFLKKIKNTVLKRMEYGNVEKKHNHMLIDVLSELEFRKIKSS